MFMLEERHCTLSLGLGTWVPGHDGWRGRVRKYIWLFSCECKQGQTEVGLLNRGSKNSLTKKRILASTVK